MIDGYNQLDTVRAQFLKTKYGADYVVIKISDHRGDIHGLEGVYRDDTYMVLKIP